MEILPAIDLLAGRVVRLTQGDYDQQKAYSPTPGQAAGEFIRSGVKWIHVVDLDAARSGQPTNTEQIRQIYRLAHADGVKVQLGGGARDEKTIDAMLANLADRVVVGSAALRDWPWFEGLLRREELSGRVALGLDARDGRLAASGWREQTDITAVELARRAAGWPLAAIVYTDISRDGELAGVNIDATAELIAATDVPVIASGGVCSLDDVLKCKEIGCKGTIIGKALYEGKIDLAQACKLAGE